MKKPKGILLEYLAAFPTPAKAASLFTENGAIEIPYFASVNLPSRVVGPADIEKFITALLTIVPNWRFSNTRVLIENDTQVFAEYEVHAYVKHNKKPFDQLFFGRLVLDENGKIKLLREALNSVTAQALLIKS